MEHLVNLVIAAMLTYSTGAIAQRCGATCANFESLLGMSEQTLVASIPELIRIPKPVQGIRNSRGKWTLADFVFATHRYTATYYISARSVTRIELLSNSPRLQCTQRVPFESALRELVNTYGESQAVGTFENDGKTTQSVAFNTQVMDISLHLSLSPDDCETRVIYKTRDVKDASEL